MGCMASRCQQSLQNQEEQMWLGGGHPRPLFWALLLQHQEGPPEPLQAQRSPQSLGQLALHRRGVHSGDSRTPGWDGGQILEELLPPAGRPASSGFTLRIRGGQHSLRASVSPCAGLRHGGSEGAGRGAALVGPPAGSTCRSGFAPGSRAHAGRMRPCTRTRTARAVCTSPHGSTSR